MANEATLIEETHVPTDMTCGNATGIERGALLTLSDLNTAATVTVSGAAVAGICAEEKIASDGKTSVPVYRGGRFKVTASGSITVGQPVVYEGGNVVLAADPAATKRNYVAGIALETATAGETLQIELRPGYY